MLKVSNITAGYGDLTVLREVTFEVRHGEFLALVGSNAAGKSTLLRSIFGFLPLQDGSVKFEGVEIKGWAPHDIARLGISLVLEQSMLRGLSVHDNLMLGAYRKEARKLIQRSMDEVVALFPILATRQHQIASSLSGGEQQMLCIARALMSRPKLLILDEPSVGLSPFMVSTILDAIRKLNINGLTVFLVEQNVAQTLKSATRAYVIENGRIILEGASKELLENQSVIKAYLGI
jgi:branched-chain amino acid transport system ATP-binding protein